jgi:hypothetical protein
MLTNLVSSGPIPLFFRAVFLSCAIMAVVGPLAAYIIKSENTDMPLNERWIVAAHGLWWSFAAWAALTVIFWMVLIVARRWGWARRFAEWRFRRAWGRK